MGDTKEESDSRCEDVHPYIFQTVPEDLLDFTTGLYVLCICYEVGFHFFIC